LARLSLAFIIAGALGNFYDRLFIGKVRDFAEIVFFGLDLPILGETFAIFNLADNSLTAGVIMFVIFFLFKYKPPGAELVGPVKPPDADGRGQTERLSGADKNAVAGAADARTDGGAGPGSGEG
jgi:hypothetical protein